MDFKIKQLSGNSYTVSVITENNYEKELFKQHPISNHIIKYYHDAIRSHFGDGILLASLTPNDDYPCSVTVELASIGGSI